MMEKWGNIRENIEKGVKLRRLTLYLALTIFYFGHEQKIVDFVTNAERLMAITLKVGNILAFLLIGAVFSSIVPLLPTLIWLFIKVISIGDIHLMMDFTKLVSFIVITIKPARKWLKLTNRVRKSLN